MALTCLKTTSKMRNGAKKVPKVKRCARMGAHKSFKVSTLNMHPLHAKLSLGLTVICKVCANSYI